MSITIIGNGNMAKGIAIRLLSGGHTVKLHVRDTAKGNAAVDEIKAVQDGTISVHEVGEAIDDDIVIVATHFGEIEAAASNYNKFAGKIVVDISNPVDFAAFQLIPEPGTSGAEMIAAALPDATIVKAFNTVFSATLKTGEVDGKPLDVFIAGDDETAKTTIAEIVKDGGMRAIDVGPLTNARHLEGFELLHMLSQDQVGGNWASAIKILG